MMDLETFICDEVNLQLNQHIEKFQATAVHVTEIQQAFIGSEINRQLQLSAAQQSSMLQETSELHRKELQEFVQQAMVELRQDLQEQFNALREQMLSTRKKAEEKYGHRSQKNWRTASGARRCKDQIFAPASS